MEQFGMLRKLHPTSLEKKELSDLSGGRDMGWKKGGVDGTPRAVPGCCSLLCLPPHLIFCHFQRQEKGDIGLDP
jgi:hypothetical protein